MYLYKNCIYLTFIILVNSVCILCQLDNSHYETSDIHDHSTAPQRRNDRFLNLDDNKHSLKESSSEARDRDVSNEIPTSEAKYSKFPANKPNNEFCTAQTSCANAIERGERRPETTADININTDQKSNTHYDDNTLETMVLIDEGTFEMGSNDARYKADGEGPVRNVSVPSFYLDKFTVSNKNFQEFLDESGYTTDAEKYGNSFVFDRLLPEDIRDDFQDVRAVQAKWWIKLNGATWNHPEGPESTITDRMNHPVVHVSWHDAQAYCAFYNKKLPSENEWEKACRGGLRQKLYPWGNAFNAKHLHRANIWHGNFPYENTKDDGYFGTCPVDEFEPNNYGLYNMVGNIWEWTATPANSYSKVDRIKKGGSFMCHESYCYRYRCAARSHNTDDSTASNLGFRCAKSVNG